MMHTLLLAEELYRPGRVGFPILTSIVAVPAAGAAVVAVLPRAREELTRLVGFLFMIATAVMAVLVLIQFKRGEGGFQFVSSHSWISEFGISWKLGIDGISLFLVLLSALLFPLAIVGPRVHKDVKSYIAWMLLLEAGCIGTFLSLDLFLFFMFFEVVLVPMYFLIGGWGYERRVYAALKVFIYTLTGSALLFVGTLVPLFLDVPAADTHVTFHPVSPSDHIDLAPAPG